MPGVPNLWATKIDPKAAARPTRRASWTTPAGGAAPRQYPGDGRRAELPCTEEIAAFDKFIEYAAQDDWQVTVFDTAPTGHTLRMLQLPVDWSKQIDIKVYARVDGAAADDVAKARFGGVIAHDAGLRCRARLPT